MSYILEALKKSESERRQGEVPDLGASIQMVHHRRRKGVPAVFWVALALVLNAFVLAYVFWPHSPKSAAAPAEKAVPSESVAPQTTSASSQRAAQPERTAEPVAQPPANTTAPQALSEPPSPSVAQPPRYSEPSSQGEPTRVGSSGPAAGNRDEVANNRGQRGSVVVASEPLSLSPSPQVNGDTLQYGGGQTTGGGSANAPADEPLAVEMTVPDLGDMPMSFQRAMPDLVFNSHIYSAAPASRRVMINSNYLREGDRFNGLIVEEITEEGVILNHNGTMVRVSVVNDWIAPR